MNWPPRIVLCNGCFDILHSGHVEHLREARQMGDKLVVALTIDGKVNKGPHRPIHAWNDRAFVLRELRCVDEVVPTSGGVAAILHIKPTYFVKGIDYADGKHWTEDVVRACEKVGTIIKFTQSPKQSSADIIRKSIL